MDVVRLDPRQLKQASDVLAAAFFNYPMFVFYFPNAKLRAHHLSWYLRNVLRTALRYGEVYTTPEITGVIFTLPPGHTMISLWEYVQNGFFVTPFVLGLRHYIQSMACEDFVADTQEKLMNNRVHYYLWGLAVAPGQQGKGIGTALMQPVLAKANAEKIPIYLETHEEKNIHYYQRYGFDLINMARIPRYDLPIWCMLREPV